MKTTTIASMMLLLASTTAISQITITSSDMPSVGQSNLLNTALDLEIDFTSTGANQTWNFSSLTPMYQVQRTYSNVSDGGMLVQFTFGPLAGNYSASYFTEAVDMDLSQLGGVLPIQVDNISQYYKKTSGSLKTVGFSASVSGTAIPAKSDTIETKYELPLNFGDNYNSRGYTFINAAPIYDAQVKQYRQRTSVVDGWGTIVTPMGSFQALRIKHRINEQDSIDLTGTWMGIAQPTKYEYEWLAAGKTEPVFKINTRMMNNSEVVTNIEYMTDEPLASNSLTSTDFTVFPNPVKESLTISTDAMIERLIIVDGTGKVVMEEYTLTSGSKVDIRELPAGIYQIIAERMGERRIQKLVKQ